MNRRGFFGVLAGLVGLGAVIKPPVDWSWVKPGWLRPEGGVVLVAADRAIKRYCKRDLPWRASPNGLRLLQKANPEVVYIVLDQKDA